MDDREPGDAPMVRGDDGTGAEIRRGHASLSRSSFEYDYQAAAEVAALRHYRDNEPGRAIPSKATGRLRLATWNVANLRVQARRDQDYRLIAELVTWFDLVALQKVNDDLSGLRAIQSHLPPSNWALFSDAGGNDERLAFLYDADIVQLLEKVGKISAPPTSSATSSRPASSSGFWCSILPARPVWAISLTFGHGSPVLDGFDVY